MKPLFLAPLTGTRTIAVFYRPDEGYIVIEGEQRHDGRYIDLSTQRGPFTALGQGITVARWVAAQARKAA